MKIQELLPNIGKDYVPLSEPDTYDGFRISTFRATDEFIERHKKECHDPGCQRGEDRYIAAVERREGGCVAQGNEEWHIHPHMPGVIANSIQEFNEQLNNTLRPLVAFVSDYCSIIESMGQQIQQIKAKGKEQIGEVYKKHEADLRNLDPEYAKNIVESISPVMDDVLQKLQRPKMRRDPSDISQDLMDAIQNVANKHGLEVREIPVTPREREELVGQSSPWPRQQRKSEDYH